MRKKWQNFGRFHKSINGKNCVNGIILCIQSKIIRVFHFCNREKDFIHLYWWNGKRRKNKQWRKFVMRQFPTGFCPNEWMKNLKILFCLMENSQPIIQNKIILILLIPQKYEGAILGKRRMNARNNNYLEWIEENVKLDQMSNEWPQFVVEVEDKKFLAEFFHFSIFIFFIYFSFLTSILRNARSFLCIIIILFLTDKINFYNFK